jgi:hypothetical protein
MQFTSTVPRIVCKLWRSGGHAVMVVGASCFMLSGCHQGPPVNAAASASDTKSDAGPKEDAAEGVTLTADQVQKLAVVSQPAQSIQYVQETAGYGVVLSHDTIAQAVAELVTAQATARLSHSALERAKKLTGTAGAVSADVEETAAQKAAIDEAALRLTQQRLSATLGMQLPWKDGDGTLQALSSGKWKLVRATFPLGALGEATPARLRATHIGAAEAGTGWRMTEVWDAPADANMPGRSYFALLKNGEAREGERLSVWAAIDAAESGVIIPASAIVLSDGKYWCYVEKKPGTFVRMEIDIGKPVAAGYFVKDGVAAGDKVVVSSAGQLLAKESGSGAEAD